MEWQRRRACYPVLRTLGAYGQQTRPLQHDSDHWAAAIRGGSGFPRVRNTGSYIDTSSAATSHNTAAFQGDSLDGILCSKQSEHYWLESEGAVATIRKRKGGRQCGFVRTGKRKGGINKVIT